MPKKRRTHAHTTGYVFWVDYIEIIPIPSTQDLEFALH